MNKHLRYISVLGSVLLTVAALALVPYVLPFFVQWLLPFILAFFIGKWSRKPMRFLVKKLKMHREVSSAFILVLILGVIAGLVTLLVYRMAQEVKDIATQLPDAVEQFKFQLTNLTGRYNDFYRGLPPDAAVFFDGLIAAVNERFTDIAPYVTGRLLSFAASVPGIVVFIVILLLSSFFFIKDYDLVESFFKEAIPAKWQEGLAWFSNIFIGALFGYVKAQSIIAGITALICTICIWAMNVQYALIAGVAIMIADFIPIIGPGFVLFPWALVSFIYGDYYRGISLLILQGVCFFVRQLLEPRIFSRQVGVHPILILLSVYFSYRVVVSYHDVGGWAILLGPIIAVLAANAYIAYKENKEEKG